MPSPTERTRLKKKMLDRWENEGGRIAADSSAADDAKPPSAQEGEGNKRSASRGNPTVGAPAPRAKGRKATRK